MNPYEVLGVGRTAKPATIKKAFRRKSMATHPDRGGDRAEFEAARLAYAVLSDPARRAHYDATGEIQDMVDNAAAAGMSVLAQCLQAIVLEMVKIGKKAEEEDLVALLKEAIRQKKEAIATEQRKLVKIRAFLTASAERFATDEGDNVLSELAKGHLAIADREDKNLAAQAKQCEEAVKILKPFRFKHEAKKIIQWMAYTPTTATTATTW